MPENYCRDQLDTLCTPTALGVVYAERCLVYACSTRVHGVGFRYVLGIIGMTLQLVVCIVILTDRGTLFKKHVDEDVDARSAILKAEAEKLKGEVEQLERQIENITEQRKRFEQLKSEKENSDGTPASTLYPRPARPGLRLRPNVSTYSRVRQLDF